MLIPCGSSAGLFRATDGSNSAEAEGILIANDTKTQSHDEYVATVRHMVGTFFVVVARSVHESYLFKEVH